MTGPHTLKIVEMSFLLCMNENAVNVDHVWLLRVYAAAAVGGNVVGPSNAVARSHSGR